MVDKDRLIIIFYVDCKGLSVECACNLLDKIKHYVDNEFDDSIHPIVVPCRSGLEHNKVECLRPDLMTDKQIKTFECYEKMFNKFLNNKDSDN